ncbi:hypothetical protein E2562_036248, partial [Oryza meyeriana var. granulata]
MGEETRLNHLHTGSCWLFTLLGCCAGLYACSQQAACSAFSLLPRESVARMTGREQSSGWRRQRQPIFEFLPNNGGESMAGSLSCGNASEARESR